MNRKLMLTVWMMMGLGLCMAAASVAADDKKENESGDKEFVTKVAASGLAEVNMSELAVRFSRDAAVRQFAQRMIADHMRANQELTQLANQKSIKLPSKMDDEHQKIYDKLKTLSGKEFDEKYMEAMMKDHDKAVKLFETESKEGKDQAVKQWATQVAPIIKRHHDAAKKICEQGKSEKKDKG